MFGDGRRPKQEPNRPISHKTINWPIRAVNELSKLRVGPGLALKWIGGIPVLEWLGIAPLYAKVPAGGLNTGTWDDVAEELTPGTTDCTVFRWTGTKYKLLTKTRTVANPFLDGPPENSLIKIEYFDSQWQVAAVGCTTLT